MEYLIPTPAIDMESSENHEPALQQFSPKTLREVKLRGHILVIDDEQPILDLMRVFLHPYGVKVHAFTNPIDALSWFEENWNSIALVFLDMKNPHMDGEFCFARLQIINSDVRVALMSGNVDAKIIKELLNEGALRFFPKPFDFPTLVGWALHTGMPE